MCILYIYIYPCNYVYIIYIYTHTHSTCMRVYTYVALYGNFCFNLRMVIFPLGEPTGELHRASWIPWSIGCVPISQTSWGYGRPRSLGTQGSSLVLSQWGGTPIAGWFISWKILLKRMIWGYPHFRKHPDVVVTDRGTLT